MDEHEPRNYRAERNTTGDTAWHSKGFAALLTRDDSSLVLKDNFVGEAQACGPLIGDRFFRRGSRSWGAGVLRTCAVHADRVGALTLHVRAM